MPNPNNPPHFQAEVVLQVLRSAAARFEEQRDEERAREVREALDAALAEMASEWGGVPSRDIVYSSSVVAVARVQSAMKEGAEGAPAGALWEGGGLMGTLEDAAEAARDALVDYGPEPPFDDPPTEALILPNEARVVLVADWADGTDGADRVAARIAELSPHIVIHLGDIYGTGTKAEIRDHFIRRWDRHLRKDQEGNTLNTEDANGDGVRVWHGSGGWCRFLAIPGNHETYSSVGIPYPRFWDASQSRTGVMSWCYQKTSYFSLKNDHWKLVALDTAWKAHDLTGKEQGWLASELASGPRKIILSHHQLFSALDSRPAEKGGGLREKWAAVYDPAAHNVFGWFCGHHHALEIYDASPDLGFPFWARCIGHGGKDIKWRQGEYSNPTFIYEHKAIPPDHLHPPAREVGFSKPGPDGPLAQNGFALLSFDGPAVRIDYMGERYESGGAGEQGVWLSERWPEEPATVG